jgi:type IV pilus assembly protein PilE
MKKNKQSAFTLIELLITVVIVGILAAFSYPSYISFINSSKEAEARAAMMSLASVLSQYHIDGGTYVGASLGDGGIFADQVPISGGGTRTYQLALSNLTATGYLITATPAIEGDGLITYTLDEAGNKTPTGW